MSLLDQVRYRLRVLLRPGAYQRELDEELQFHLAQEAMHREHDARGALSPDAARFAARKRYGNPTYLSEERRRMAGLGFFDMARQDVRFALRSFARTPGFTAVAVATLALGIGGTTAIFSAVNALLLRPLPFRAPDRLMMVGLTAPPSARGGARDMVRWSYPKFVQLRDGQTVFEDLAVTVSQQMTVVPAGGEAERIWVEVAGARYLPTLGVRPVLGRGFLAEEDSHPGAPKVALLGDALWKRHYNADPAAIGRVIALAGEPYTIVGVLPPGFGGITGQSELMVPVMTRDAEELAQPWNLNFTVVARLKDGVTPERAVAETKQLGAAVNAATPNPFEKEGAWGANARLLDAGRVDPKVGRSLYVLLGAVGLMLLIACANVANLFLVRASGRRREIAVRLAVGAGRGRLMRQLLTESVLLSALGGVASLFIAWGGVRMLSTINPASALRTQQLGGLGVVNFGSIGLDLATFGFAALVTLLTGFIFGLVPALQSTRPSLTAELKDGAQGGVVLRFGSRDLLAAVEIALALMLLAGSGLMIRSLGKLLRVDAGFVADGVLTVRLNPAPGFARDSLPLFQTQLLERVGSIAGVTSVALSDCPPLNGGCNGTVVALRDRPAGQPGNEPDAGVHWITPAWSRTLGVPLIRGRLFTDADRLGAPKAVLVSETTAKRFWPGEEPIGRPVGVGQGGFWGDTAYVVGVVGDVRFGTIDGELQPEVFLPYYQSPNGRMMLFVKTQGDPLSIAGPVRRVLRELAPEMPIYDIRTLPSRAADAISYARSSTILLVIFGAVALALATIGTYGVVSFAVTQRTREIGIRVALGASRVDVTRLVVGQGLAIALIGGTAGLAGAFVATRLLRSQLYGVEPSDPATFVAIGAMLTAAVLVASWIPARRATGIHPTEALREG
ncbi:MAG: ABC transporter permease [Gemmatimonadales bacterium]|nr:ABC transporter permease [Gemmatimonadales bacterium]